MTNAPNISTVNQVKTKAEQLDQAMERLINGIQDKDQGNKVLTLQMQIQKNKQHTTMR